MLFNNKVNPRLRAILLCVDKKPLFFAPHAELHHHPVVPRSVPGAAASIASLKPPVAVIRAAFSTGPSDFARFMTVGNII
jgi:hypothetical protein